MDNKLWSHQQVMVDFMDSRPSGLLYAEMGTGKTLAGLTWVQRNAVKRALVVTKKRIIEVWAEEAEKFGLTDSMELFTGKESWTVKQFSDRLRDWLADGSNRQKVVVVNYEKIWRKPLYVTLMQAEFDALLLDESHKVKAHNSQISKAAYKLSREIPRRYLLTGTPMPNGPIDMYGQWRIIDDRLIEVVPGSKAFGRFQAHYALLEPVRGAGPGVVKIVGYQRMGEFQEKMKRTTLKIKAEDVLDLPSEHHITRHVQMSAYARKLYKEFAKELILEMDDGVVTASNILVKSLRLRQLTGGFVTTEDTGKTVMVDDAKIKMTLDLLEDLPPDEPVVIFAKFTQEINSLRRALQTGGHSASVLSGSVNQLKEWKAGKTQALIVQVDTGAEGISLTRAKYAILYSLGYSLGVYEQLLARQRRPGQQGDRVTYYHLIARGTIDEDVNAALQNKREVNGAILEGLRGYGSRTTTYAV